MNSVFNTGMQLALISSNNPTTKGLGLMWYCSDQIKMQNRNFRNRMECKEECKEKTKDNICDYTKYVKVKHTRAYNIPEDEKRCSAITKKGEQCACRKVQNSDYCVIHNKKFYPKPNEEDIVVKIVPVRKTWKNLYGFIK